MSFSRGTPVWQPGNRDRAYAGTVAVATSHEPPPLPAQDAFAAAYDHVRALARLQPDAVLVAAVGSEGQVFGMRVLAVGDAITLGRHPQCAIALPGATTALRQLTAQAQRDRDGALVLRVWNLATATPFSTEDGQRCDALAAEGPVFLGVRSYAVCMVPLRPPAGVAWPATAGEAWEALPPREIVSRLADGSHAVQPLPAAMPPREAGRRTTRITRLPAPVPVLELDDGAVAVARLIIADASGTRAHAVTAEALQRGVLVGRYDRCGACVADDERVSRVHLLIAGAEDGAWAIDTASTNGTRGVRGELTSTRLEDGDVLCLADSALVTWRPVAVGAA